METKQPPYVVDTTEGYKNVKLDMPRFAADLAKALGGKLVPTGDMSRAVDIAIGNDHVRLTSHDYRRPVRVHVSIAAPDVKHNDRNYGYDQHKTENANVNPDGRSIETIARDIKRRVIDASQPALKLQREHAAELAQQRADIVKQAKELKAQLPAAKIDVNERERCASVYLSEPYISATLYADGRVSISRIGTIAAGKFTKLVKAIS